MVHIDIPVCPKDKKLVSTLIGQVHDLQRQLEGLQEVCTAQMIRLLELQLEPKSNQNYQTGEAQCG